MKARDIIIHAATLFDISVEQLLSRSRTREVAAVRAAIIYAIEQRYPELSMQTIVELLNMRDRKSAYNSIKRCEQYMRQSADYARKVKILAGMAVEQPHVEPQKFVGSPDHWALYNATRKGTARVLSA